jgi:hypothetical protein
MTATIAIPERLRDRLKLYGHAGMTYPDIIKSLLDRVQRDEFVAEMRKLYAETPRSSYIDLDDL